MPSKVYSQSKFSVFFKMWYSVSELENEVTILEEPTTETLRTSTAVNTDTIPSGNIPIKLTQWL